MSSFMAFLNTRLGAAAAAAVAGLIFVAPNIVHALDRGSAEVDAGAFKEDALPSRNVRLSGVVDYEAGVDVTSTTKDNASQTRTTYYPINGLAGTAGDPNTTLLLLSNEGDLARVESAERRGDVEWVTLNGVVRNVLWENFHWSLRSNYKKVGLESALRERVVLIEVAGSHATSDLLWALGVPLALFAFGLFAGGRNSRPAPPAPTPAS